MVVHVLRNVLTPIIVLVTVSIGLAILTAAGLSFVGLGAQPPTPEWGDMLNEAQNYLQQAWWMAVFPGAAIMLVVVGLNLLGDGLREMLDPAASLMSSTVRGQGAYRWPLIPEADAARWPATRCACARVYARALARRRGRDDRLPAGSRAHPHREPSRPRLPGLRGVPGRLAARLGYQVEYLERARRGTGDAGTARRRDCRASTCWPACPALQPRPVLHFNGHYRRGAGRRGLVASIRSAATIRDGRIYGRGVSDMKGGIAAQIFAVEALRRAGFILRGTVEQSFVARRGEHRQPQRRHGLSGRAAATSAADRTDYVVITEPLEVDNICLGHRGTIQGAFETIGRQAHGAMPERGVNAIEKMALALAAIERELKPLLRERRSQAACDPRERLRLQHHHRHHRRRHQHQYRGRALPRHLRPSAGGERDGRRRRAPSCWRSSNAWPPRTLIFTIATRSSMPPTRCGWASRHASAPPSPPRSGPCWVASRAWSAAPAPTTSASWCATPGCGECIVYGPGEIRQTHVVDESLALADLRAAAEVMALATLDLLGYDQLGGACDDT